MAASSSLCKLVTKSKYLYCFRTFSSFSHPVIFQQTKNNKLFRTCYFPSCTLTTWDRMKRRTRRENLLVLLVVGGLGAAFLLIKKKIELSINPPEFLGEDYAIEEPYYKVSKQVDGPNGLFLNVHPQLFQYQFCPQCSKIRTYLEYYGIGYDITEVHPMTKREINRLAPTNVPIVFIKAEKFTKQFTDSSLVISIFHSYLANKDFMNINNAVKKYSLKSPEQARKQFEVQNKYDVYKTDDFSQQQLDAMQEEKRWRAWVDEWFVHLLPINLYRTDLEAKQAFKYFSKTGDWKNCFAWLDHYALDSSFPIYTINSATKIKRKYNIKDEDVRELLYNACNDWIQAIGTNRRFMGGDKPNLADLAVFGTLRIAEECTTFQDVLKNTNIKSWYLEMRDTVTSHQGYKAS